MPEYIIQKAVEPAKVIKANRRTLAEYGAMFYAQHKYDGCCAVIDTTDRRAYSRTGEDVLSMEAQVNDLSNYMGPGYVVVAEAWSPDHDFSTISGAFRKKSEQRPWLRFVVNDVLTREEFDAGYSARPWVVRFGMYGGLPQSANRTHWAAYTRPPGTYGDAQEYCDDLVAHGGYDGLVLKHGEGTWTKGSKGTTGEIIKIKRQLSFDLRVTGIFEATGEKTGRPVYTISVDFKGKTLMVGSGIPHKLSEVPKVGQIVEVVAMDYSSDGLLREPRYKGIRHDKLEPDT